MHHVWYAKVIDSDICTRIQYAELWTCLDYINILVVFFQHRYQVWNLIDECNAKHMISMLYYHPELSRVWSNWIVIHYTWLFSTYDSYQNGKSCKYYGSNENRWYDGLIKKIYMYINKIITHNIYITRNHLSKQTNNDLSTHVCYHHFLDQLVWH